MKIIKQINLPCGQAYLLKTSDDHFLETGDVFMSQEESIGSRPYKFSDFKNPGDTNKRVMTICTLSGCPMHCRFCASRRSYKRKLSTQELIDQVETMIATGAKFGRNPDPNNAKEFRVLFTRMGEPLLNTTAVIEAIKILIKRYPHVNIGLSTSGIKKGFSELIKEDKSTLSKIDMQFSLHSTSDEEREYLFDLKPGQNIMSIPEIASATEKWYQKTNHPVCLNVIIFKDFTYDFKSLLKYFNKDQIWLRLSPWNQVSDSKDKYHFEGLLRTDDVINKKPLSSKHLRKIISDVEELGLSYSYAPAIDIEIENNIACGQALEAFKNELSVATSA